MKILIVGLVKNEQLTRLKEEAGKRGHEVEGAYTSELIVDAATGKFKPRLRTRTLSKYDLIYLWATGKRKWEWFVASLWLNKNHGTKIVNHKVIDASSHYYLTPAIDYLTQVENDLPFPKSAVIYDATGAEKVSSEFIFPAILKTSEGRKGQGVFKVESPEDMINKVREMSEDTRAFVVREFIPNDGDVRIFTVGYKAIGAMRRTAAKGDFRSNISQGGSGSEFDLKKNPEVRKIAEHLSEAMQTEIAGVDIIIDKETKKPYILEINPGPQFTGLEQFTSANAALEIIKYFEKRAKE